MRFKRLRLFTAIALVMFILIVGNILAFGAIQKSGLFKERGDDDNVAPIYVDKSPSVTTTQPSATTTTQTQTQPTVIFHTTTRTAAS